MQEAGILLFLMTMGVEKEGMYERENSYFLPSYELSCWNKNMQQADQGLLWGGKYALVI